MSEIRFYAPDTPNFEQANMLAKLAVEQSQKTADGFKDTAKGFTDAVVKSNHSLIKEQLDALTPEQLQDKVAVNALVNSLTKDTGYMYDAPVVDAYVEARPDILQQRALEAEKLKQQELANQASEYNHRVTQLEQDKKARDELRQDLLSQFIHYIGKGDTDTTLKLLQQGKDLFPSSEEMQAFLHLGLDKYTNDQEMDALKKAQLQAQTNALLTQANVAKQNADTNQFTAEQKALSDQEENALKAFGLANSGGNGSNGSKDSNGGKQQDPIQKTVTENSLKKLNELGMPNAVEQNPDGSFAVNYNTINSTVQNNISKINEKYIESTDEYEKELNKSEYMQSMGKSITDTKLHDLKTFVNKYETTDDKGNKRPLRADEKEEIYRRAVLGDIRFDEWFSFGKGDRLDSNKIEPYLKQYNNEITKKANTEITSHVADTLSSLSQITGMTNGQLAYALGWGKGTDMFKHLPKSIQNDINHLYQENAKKASKTLVKQFNKGMGNTLKNAVKQSTTTVTDGNGNAFKIPSTLARKSNNKPYADVSLGKYRNGFNH